MKEKCERCKKMIPQKFMSMMCANGAYTYVDPECALAVMSEVHGMEFTEFNGEVAQQMLEDYQAWKKVEDDKKECRKNITEHARKRAGMRSWWIDNEEDS